MNEQERKKAYDRWQLHKDEIAAATSVQHADTPEERKARICRLRRDYNAFVEYYFPHYVVNAQTGKATKCAPFHVRAAKTILKNPNLKAAFVWARGHAKSTHMDIFIPLWLLAQEQPPLHTMVLVSKSEDMAKTLLSDIQAELESNQRYIDDYGLQRSDGDWQDGEFVTKSGAAFFARGRGQSPRGLRYKANRPDYVVIDDIDDDELCRNEKRVSDTLKWVKEALFGALDGGRGRFIIVGNLIAKNSVLQGIVDTPGVQTIQVNVYDKDGNPSWADKYTPEEIAEARSFMGERSFQKEMMNNPIIDGSVFKQSDITFGKMLPLHRYRQLVCYTDPSFKSSATADYKATALVGITPDGYFHVIKMYAAQTTVGEMVNWHYDIDKFISGKAAVTYYMEANFMQDLMLDEFRKAGESYGKHIPIVGDKRQKGEKFARIEAMQPLFERGLVILNEAEQNAPGMKVLQEQLLMFAHGSGAHDDAPDAVESAVWMLNRSFKNNSFPVLMHSRKELRRHWF
ncbi:MAG: phage terminase large subunit [Bacteroidales bacterium]|nr:phage terminase large subunit [Bacteroidales bacterium]